MSRVQHELETAAAPLSGDPESSATTSHVLLADRYELLGLLGVGAMGAVYRARDTLLDETVALKLLRRELASDEAALARFRSEVRLARKVTHVNVARTFDLGEVGAELFLTMELVGGESLGARLDREKVLTVFEVGRIATQIVQGLMAAHASGVVHRDLKPDNVMLDGERVALTDFGVARAFEQGKSRHTVGVAGTPAYMAPEQVEGAPDIDGRVDLYALGIMLFEMLSGELPFKGETAISVAAARLLFDAPSLQTVRPDVPSFAARLVAKLLCRAPAERPTGPEILAALASFTSHHRSMPPPASDKPARGETRDRTVAVLPFVNRGSADDAYLAEGLAEDVVDALTGVDGLRVRSFGQTRARAQAGSDPRDIGRALDVQALVEGTLRREGTRLRLAARVVTVNDGFQLWAKRFVLQPDDLGRAADAIAEDVARALTCTSTSRHAPIDAEAYDLYLRGKFVCRRDVWSEAHTEGLRLLRQARSRAPSDARVCGALAIELARSLVAASGEGGPVIAEAHAAATAARALDATRAEPAVARAILHWMACEPEPCVAALQEAFSLDRDHPEALLYLGRLLAEGGHASEGMRVLRRALLVEPELASARLLLFRARSLLGDGQSAESELSEQDNRASAAAFARARCVLWHRDAERARWLVAALAEWGVDALARERVGLFMAPALGALDPAQLPFARAALRADVGAPSRRAFLAQLRAEFFAVLGETETVIEAVESADANGTLDAAWVTGCPLFADLQSNARFAAAQARIVARAEAIMPRLLALASRVS